MSRVIHFEINADSPEKMAEFYSSVFGWMIAPKQTADYWLVYTGRQDERGINGGMKKKTDPKRGIVNTINVNSVEQTISKIKKSGGKVHEPFLKLPGTGLLAYCEDPEGNSFCILQYDSTVK